jgi:myo-inositol-1-phosphate synthase
LGKVRVAIAGVGNCASSLIQGVEYYRGKREEEVIGLLHYEIGGIRPWEIDFVCCFDVDKRKVGKDLSEAIFSPPNCAIDICNVPHLNTTVEAGFLLDGVSSHMSDYAEDRRFVVDESINNSNETWEEAKARITERLKETSTEILLLYLPVGSQKACEFYASCCLDAGVALINCIPIFIASSSEWEERFRERGIPIIGDDIKSQLGATILHRTLTRLFEERGLRIERTYQLNTGGNTDFLNMLNRDRLDSKRTSKTQSVQSQLKRPLDPENIHIGPSDYVPWQLDNKVCFIRIEARGFADVPLNLELRLSVEDSPNSAGVVIDAIRCCKLALEKGIGGCLIGPSAYFMKSPPQQMSDVEARRLVDEFIGG